jgi:cytochrome c oxidase assembly factor CtaG
LYELALRFEFWHEVQHFFFLGTGLLFWWPVVQPWPSRLRWPRWAMIPYLLFADIQNTALSAFLIFSERVVYPTYAAVPRLWGISALDDQAAAGAIMWVPGSVIFLIPVGILAVRLLDAPRTATSAANRVNYEIAKAK